MGNIRELDPKKLKNVFLIVGGVIGLSWIFFFIYDWKIALFVMLIMWSNNLLRDAGKL